jgi:hypothetical protein
MGKTQMEQAKNPALGGMAGQAQNALRSTPQYREYAVQAQANGEPVLPMAQWMKQNGG